jgi:hypothetical protein
MLVFVTTRPPALRTRGGGVEMTSVICCALTAKVIWTCRVSFPTRQ